VLIWDCGAGGEEPLFTEYTTSSFHRSKVQRKHLQIRWYHQRSGSVRRRQLLSLPPLAGDQGEPTMTKVPCMVFTDEPIGMAPGTTKVCQTECWVAAFAALSSTPPRELSLSLLQLFNEFRSQSCSLKKNEIATELHD